MTTMPTRYVCGSRICPQRDICDLASTEIASDVIHIIYFRPQEEIHGNCPHFQSSWSEDANDMD